MKYFVCLLLFVGAAYAQWNNNGQWNNNWSGNDNGQYRGDNSGQWDGDQGGQWNPYADGSLAGQWNQGAPNNWAGPQAAPPQQWNNNAQWGQPGVPQDTPEVAAAKAAHLAVHAQAGHRWRRSAVIAAAPLVTPWAAHSLWHGRSILAPTFTTAHAWW